MLVGAFHIREGDTEIPKIKEGTENKNKRGGQRVFDDAPAIARVAPRPNRQVQQNALFLVSKNAFNSWFQ